MIVDHDGLYFQDQDKIRSFLLGVGIGCKWLIRLEKKVLKFL